LGRKPGSPNRGKDTGGYVSSQDAVEYAKWLSSETGKHYRLPNNAEWEYAARSGGKEEDWAGTSREEELGDYAWYEANSGFRTHPVGGKKPNGLGLCDMSGNVREWVQVEDMSSGSDVARGGSWGGPPEDLWVANWFRVTSGFSNFHLGFRLARDIDQIF